jgi:hypothetical protein
MVGFLMTGCMTTGVDLSAQMDTAGDKLLKGVLETKHIERAQAKSVHRVVSAPNTRRQGLVLLMSLLLLRLSLSLRMYGTRPEAAFRR